MRHLEVVLPVGIATQLEAVRLITHCQWHLRVVQRSHQ